MEPEIIELFDDHEFMEGFNIWYDYLLSYYKRHGINEGDRDFLTVDDIKEILESLEEDDILFKFIEAFSDHIQRTLVYEEYDIFKELYLMIQDYV